MPPSSRKTAFVITASDHGTMIINRFDHATVGSATFGVGFQIMELGGYDKPEVNLLLALLTRRRAHFGDGVVALDCGANIGVHTIEWAKLMTGWGSVVAFEAQERIFYALTGNIAINNCLNARALNVAVGAQEGVLRMPVPDYLSAGSFGSLGIRFSPTTEYIGQAIDYSDAATIDIRSMALDSLALTRLDLLKIDVEGMEAEVLEGAQATIAACRPIIVVEHIKTGRDVLVERLTPFGYQILDTAMNLIAVHPSDPTRHDIHHDHPVAS